MPRAKAKTTPDSPIDYTTQRKATCPTLGTGVQLTYEVGSDEAGTTAVRLTSNAGGGFFSKEWIALTAIQAALDAWPKDLTCPPRSAPAS
jgi:hypothetical protein